ncbi:MAG: ArsR family transcriptional regulator [Candidatus Verstraetearchaeota archaeon]|nr:ArsR family transcriptional regulator [Candidatus Verstraetearchaeota archaeon]
MQILDAILELLSDGKERKSTDISEDLKVDISLVNEALAFLVEYNFVRRGHNGSYILDEEVKRVLHIHS